MTQQVSVLILSEGFGCGHTQAAKALAAGLQIIESRIHTTVLELGSVLNPRLAPILLSAYRTALSASPEMVGKMYRKHYEKPLSKLAVTALHRLFYNQTAKAIQERKPDLIVCTHPIPAAIVSRLRRDGLTIPIYTLITDYDAHSAWIHPGMTGYLVSTPEVRSLLIQRGVDPGAIQVTGIPVHPEFWSRRPKDMVRRRLKLAELPTVLVMGGGWGLLYDDELISAMTAWKDHVQFICCTGSNERLAAQLRSMPELQHEHIRILGFTNEISQWMDASDMLVTKPGGMTCTESMAKGLPMLFYHCLPGQEMQNRDYFIRIGYGREVASARHLDQILAQICFGAEPAASSTRGKTAKLLPLPVQPASRYQPELCARQIAQFVLPAMRQRQAYL